MRMSNDDLIKKIRASQKALSKESVYFDAEQAKVMLDLLRAHEVALDAFKSLAEKKAEPKMVTPIAWYVNSKRDETFHRNVIMGWDFMKHHGDAKPGRPYGEADFDITRTHIKVKEVFSVTPEYLKSHGLLAVLEAVYIGMQGENWSPNGEARPLIQELGLRHTSMSVGDVVQINEKFYFVDSIGYIDMDTGKKVEG